MSEAQSIGMDDGRRSLEGAEHAGTYLVVGVKKAWCASESTRIRTISHESSEMVAPLDVCTFLSVVAHIRGSVPGSIHACTCPWSIESPPRPHAPCPRRAAWRTRPSAAAPPRGSPSPSLCRSRRPLRPTPTRSACGGVVDDGFSRFERGGGWTDTVPRQHLSTPVCLTHTHTLWDRQTR